jgi:hypothetical protein
MDAEGRRLASFPLVTSATQDHSGNGRSRRQIRQCRKSRVAGGVGQNERNDAPVTANSGQSPATERTARLAEWENLKYGMIFHFGMSTFTGSVFGSAHVLPSTYAPSKLDVKQWVRAAKGAGMKYAVLTVEHFSGFCLWPSDAGIQTSH